MPKAEQPEADTESQPEGDAAEPDSAAAGGAGEQGEGSGDEQAAPDTADESGDARAELAAYTEEFGTERGQRLWMERKPIDEARKEALADMRAESAAQLQEIADLKRQLADRGTAPVPADIDGESDGVCLTPEEEQTAREYAASVGKDPDAYVKEKLERKRNEEK